MQCIEMRFNTMDSLNTECEWLDYEARIVNHARYFRLAGWQGTLIAAETCQEERLQCHIPSTSNYGEKRDSSVQTIR